MRLSSDWRVTIASMYCLIVPDVAHVAKLFQNLGPVFDGLLRFGQFSVAAATVYYILKKAKFIGRRKKKQ